MKKIIYTFFVGAFMLSSCGESTTDEKKEEKSSEKIDEVVGGAEESEAEGDLITTIEEGEVMINGMHFYGLEQFDLGGEKISADSMYAAVMANGAYEGLVMAQIEEVCQKAGCWVKLKRENAEPVMVFFKDHFGIPTNTAVGTDAIMHGVAKIDTLSVDFQKHLLDDAKEDGKEVTADEYAAITEDKIEVSFEVDGILIP